VAGEELEDVAQALAGGGVAVEPGGVVPAGVDVDVGGIVVGVAVVVGGIVVGVAVLVAGIVLGVAVGDCAPPLNDIAPVA
jgi:hypothetical protein